MSCSAARPVSADASFRLASRRAVLAALIAASPLTACSQDELPLPTGSDPVTEQPAPNAKRWSDPASWPDQKPPVFGADVVIPRGTDILLDVSPPSLASLRIEGTLTADNKDLELTAGSIHVAGTLRVGGEKAPFTHRMVFTLTGDDPGGDDPAKVIAVYGGGLLELHGESRTAWTRLGATANAGSTQLLLDGPTDWRVGDRLIVASTSFNAAEAEPVRITAIDGQSVTIAEPLEYSHWGTVQTIAGATVDERAEVGLLSRNIVVHDDGRRHAYRRSRAHARGAARQARALPDSLAHDG
jgi:hypothetical protein